MRLLALDTSSPACSVALRVDARTLERHDERPREHTRLLVPMIRSLLSEARIGLADLDAIVLGNGPGSFIGVRIAASVAQGMGFAAGLQIVPVSSLAAIAVQVFAEHGAAEVVVAQDAHMEEVYLGCYARDPDGLPIETIPELLHGQAPIAGVAEHNAGDRVAAGEGWRRYPRLLEVNRPRLGEYLDIAYPRARHLLALGAREFRAGRAVRPRDVAPAYLRDRVATPPRKAS